jgi:hypothetical protein
MNICKIHAKRKTEVRNNAAKEENLRPEAGEWQKKEGE